MSLFLNPDVSWLFDFQIVFNLSLGVNFIEFSSEWVSESCSVPSNSLRPHGLYSPWNSPSQNTRVGSLSLIQGIFPTQRSNPGLLHCRRILYQLSPKGSPEFSKTEDKVNIWGCIIYSIAWSTDFGVWLSWFESRLCLCDFSVPQSPYL